MNERNKGCCGTCCTVSPAVTEDEYQEIITHLKSTDKLDEVILREMQPGFCECPLSSSGEKICLAGSAIPLWCKTQCMISTHPLYDTCTKKVPLEECIRRTKKLTAQEGQMFDLDWALRERF